MLKKRQRVLNQFENGDVRVLVCTDVVSRGIDFGKIDFVISFDCPTDLKTYIHRIGRTARAGEKGS